MSVDGSHFQQGNQQPGQGGQTPPQSGQQGQGQTPTSTTPSGQTPDGQTTSSGQTPDANAGQASHTTQQRTDLSSMPLDIQDLVRSVRGENKNIRQELDALKADKQKEAERALAEQGQWKELAEQREARITELESVGTRMTTLTTQLNEQIKSEIKDWPTELKAFDPGPDAPIEQRLEWVSKSRPLLAKLSGTQQQQQQSSPGNSPNPRGQGNQSARASEVEELRKRYAERGKPF